VSKKKDQVIKKNKFANFLVKYYQKEKFKHFLNYFITIITSLFLVIIIFYSIIYIFIYINSKSNYQKILPLETEKFAHYEVNEYNDYYLTYLYNFFEPKLNLNYLSKLTKKSKQVTFIKTEDIKNSFIFFEKIKEKDIKFFLQTLNSKVYQKENFYFIYNPISFVCKNYQSGILCHKQKAELENFIKKAKHNKNYFHQELKNLPYKKDITWYFKNTALSIPLFQAHKNYIDEIFISSEFVQKRVKNKLYLKTKNNFKFYENKIKLNNLQSLAPKENLIFSFESNNLKDNFNNQINFWQKNYPEYFYYLKGRMNFLKQKIFNNKLDIKTDFLDKITKNYSVFFHSDNNNLIVSAIFKDFPYLKLDEFLKSFAENNKEKIEKLEISLKNNKKISKVINKKNLTEKEIRINLGEIKGYQIKNSDNGLFIGKKGNLTYISNSLKMIKKIIKTEKENSFFLIKNNLEQGQINLHQLKANFSFLNSLIPNNNFFSKTKTIKWFSQTFNNNLVIDFDFYY
jgi:hypothetical protein